MKKLQYKICLLVVFFLAKIVNGQVNILDAEIQITTATLPAPEEDKDGAMVYGYSPKGSFIVLRKGTNNLICLADDPNKEGISVSCYVSSLEPFMKRGRELNAEGKNVKEKREIRGIEVAKGIIQMPKNPSMTYIYYGAEEDYNMKTGKLKNGQFRYVIYTPFATTKTTGLPSKPHAKGMPWLMDPGTFRAHIMIGPFN